jgi:hypothetical protein
VPVAPDYAPSLAAPGRRHPPQRATPKNSRLGFFGNPSGRTLAKRRSARRTAPGYRGCGYKTASGRPKWLSRDPVGESGANITLLLVRQNVVSADRMRERPTELITGPNLYRYVEDDPIDGVDPTGLFPVKYGNWCAPDWTGGQVEEYSPKHSRGHYLTPIDDLDSECRRHDICYYKCRNNNPCSPSGRSECFRQCDDVLSKNAWAIGGFAADAISAIMRRPGTRDPGPNGAGCGCGGK